jgi:hypothetical protein
MATYSFLNTNATIAGPGGIVNLAAGAAAAEEGISIEPIEDKNVMTIGADGRGQHSLIASDACKVTVRLLKTSPVNKQLNLMYLAQKQSSALWGTNVLTIANTGLGDITTITGVAFSKKPTITYAKEGGMMEWTFDGISANSVLGSG